MNAGLGFLIDFNATIIKQKPNCKYKNILTFYRSKGVEMRIFCLKIQSFPILLEKHNISFF